MLNSLNKTIGDNLIRLREQRNLKQCEAAKQLGISRQTLAKYEKPDEQAGSRRPPLEMLLRMAKFYNVSVDYLCGEIPGTTHDVSFVMEYTGLTESAVEYLHDFTRIYRYIAPGERERQKQLYKDMFGMEMHLYYWDILDVLLSHNSGFTELLQSISSAEINLSEYKEHQNEANDSLRDLEFSAVTNYINSQSLRELRFRKKSNAPLIYLKNSLKHCCLQSSDFCSCLWGILQ